MFPSHFTENKIEMIKIGARRAFPFFSSETIQPRFVQGRRCAAVHIRPTLMPQWIMVPCGKAIQSASFVCEIGINKTKIILETRERTIFKASKECPRKSINVGSSCLHIINSISATDYMSKMICGNNDLKMFLLPQFLFSPDLHLSWIRWSPDDSFLLKLLISMTHRWHNPFGQNPEHTDILVGARLGSSGKTEIVGLRYSETNLIGVQVTGMDRPVSPSGLDILLCSHSMLVTNSSCLDGHAMCKDGTCILSHYVCDGTPDCTDESDELDCSHVCSFPDGYSGDPNCYTSCVSPECKCNDLYFSCVLGGCVPWSRVCNALPDCPNGEDEQICGVLDKYVENIFMAETHFRDKAWEELGEGIYKCKNGPNISRVLVDDLVPDCPEQDDEEIYYTFLKNGSSSNFFTDNILCKEPDATTCEKNYKGVCYSRQLHCIHVLPVSHETNKWPANMETCRNGAHLKDCERHSCPSFFKCPSTFCIPVYAICNGKIDCPNGEDEEHCQKISCPGFLLCRNDRVCVHPHDVWAGRVKCPVSKDDKALRYTGACPAQCECLGNAIMCKKPIKLDLPKLPVTIRKLIISSTQFAMDTLRWEGDLVTLLHLQITFCNISSVKREHFRRLRFLQWLILRNNIIPFLPSGLFQGLDQVKNIDMGHNLISELHPDSFKGVGNVQLLKLDFNKLTIITPCTFKEMRSLTTLDLSNNYLTKLGDNVFCEPQSAITELHIGGNHLRQVDKRILESQMQNLLYLNTTPLQLCCFLPQVKQCYPKDRFFLSTCKHLLGWTFRHVIMVIGASVLLISISCIIWICRRISKASQPRDKGGSRNRNLNAVLNVLLFICHGIKGIHSIILACVEIVLRDYYALHEEMWKRHALCILLNMLPYTFLLVSIFVSLLISCVRMIACVFPFRMAIVSVSKPITCATVIFLCTSLTVSSLPHSRTGILDSNESHVALGFGLILPTMMHGQYVRSLLCNVFPLVTMLILSSAFHIACILTLFQKTRDLKNKSPNVSSGRRGSIIRCIASLILPLCCQLPLIILHVVVASGIQFSPAISVTATLFTLYGYPIINAVLYVIITPDFIHCILHYICRK